MTENTYRFNGHEVRRVGFGAMQLPGPGVWGPPRDHDQAVAVLRRAVQGGVDHIDTAQYYGPDVANQLIREALAPYPDHLRIVTKVGGRRGPNREWLRASEPQELRGAVEENLRTLGVDRLDVVNLRLPGGELEVKPGDPTLAEMLGALVDLREEGKIEGIGLSAATLEDLHEAQALTEIACVQNAYHLLDRSSGPVLEACRERGLAFVPYFPLGSAFGDSRRRIAEHPAVREVAGRHDATTAQVALAWLLHVAPNVLLIPGTSSLDHLEENLGAAGLALDDHDLHVLGAMAPEAQAPTAPADRS
ncbi:MAG TPA: oxidoreductase [Solirubrobacteraceae bacterium]|nr:oxidoreductase [Solirubrobacteraceae bacterium]